MAVQLSRDSVQKLTHESPEIRLRTLEQIEAKLQRAFVHNEDVDFKPSELCKQLIRWFGLQPLQVPAKVLKLLLRILKSNYGERALQRLGTNRLLNEMDKVLKILHGRTEEQVLVANIQQLLHSSLKDDRTKSAGDCGINEIKEILENFDINESPRDNKDVCMEPNQYPETEYEEIWSKPPIADFNSMKFLADILVNPQATCIELQNALHHLEISIRDYPPEYLLQAPNIFLKLLKLLETSNIETCKYPFEDVAGALIEFLRILKERLKKRRNPFAYAASSPPGDNEIRPKTQLRIEAALNLLVQQCLEQLQIKTLADNSENLAVAQICAIIDAALKIYEMQQLSIPSANLLILAKIYENLRNGTDREFLVLNRLRSLYVVFLLLDAVTVNANLGKPSLETSALEPLLRDYSLRTCFPTRYQCLKEQLLHIDKTLARKCDTMQKYESIFRVASQLLQNPKILESDVLILQNPDICIAVEKLQSLKLTELLFNAIINCIPSYKDRVDLKTQACELLLKLLQLTNVPMKAFVYSKLAQAFKRHFACLMNQENYCPEINNGMLLDEHIIGVPLCTRLLLQLIHESYESTHTQIQQDCVDILALLLQSQHLLGHKHWSKWLELLLPLLPLLQCCTGSTKLQKVLLKLYDPDERCLPFLDVLVGNIGSLFQPVAARRSEALTRLIYMISSVKCSDAYLPKMAEISDLLPNDLCLLQIPYDFSRLFKNELPLNTDTNILENLLNLLDSADIEPLIRKTTLMQLNLLLQNWPATTEFCDQSAHFLVLKSLEHSMQQRTASDYVDAAIPAISILCKTLLCDTELRLELASTVNIYILLLRALFFYLNDVQVRQDASICLFQLIYGNFMLFAPPGGVITVPRIFQNLQLPIKCEFKSYTEIQKPWINHYSELFANIHEEQVYLRYIIAAEVCDTTKSYKNQLAVLKQLDFANELVLSDQNYKFLKATDPVCNIRTALYTIANATTPAPIQSATILLHLELQLLQVHVPQHSDILNALVSNGIANDINKMLNKYLQQTPGNKFDLLLFEAMLVIFQICLRLQLQPVVVGTVQSLLNDTQNTFIMMLRRPELPLNLYNKLCTVLTLLLDNPAAYFDSFEDSAMRAFYSNLFITVFGLAKKFLAERNLLHVRCVCSLLKLLGATHALDISDQQLNEYIKKCILMSLALKTYTQTGAQLHRDFLSLLCHLGTQMSQPKQYFRIQGKELQFISCMCGHVDVQVRAYAWCILAKIARSTGDDKLIKDLCKFPGGFLACCLTTLFDSTEYVVVRQLAGQLFAELISNYEEGSILLEKHTYYREVYAILNANGYFGMVLPLDFNYATQTIFNCELMSAFCRITIKMIKIAPVIFIVELCEKPFMFKLYELLKLPPPTTNLTAYYSMCADICQLYAMCASENFAFLQQTLCRDQVWLKSCFQLLDPSVQAPLVRLVVVLQLLLVLLQDAVAYENFCQNFIHHPHYIVNIFILSFNVAQLSSPLQRSALGMLCLLLIKSQPEKIRNDNDFVKILDKPTTVLLPVATCGAKAESIEVTKPSSVFFFIELQRSFLHMYPTKACKFESPPSAIQVQLGETIAVLLMLSPAAQHEADNLKLLDKLVEIFRVFFEEFNTSCTTFIRRYGEAKKMAIIRNFQLLLRIIFYWYSSKTAALEDGTQVYNLCCILMQIWPWLTHSTDLRLLVLKLCAALSERSLIVCQRFSTLQSSQGLSLLQLIVKDITAETYRVKSAISDCSCITMGLVVAMNCCACIEGRVTFVKAHTLNIFDSLYPFNVKSPKLKVQIVHAWLRFWELYSRYEEGSHVRNLNALCAVINCTTVTSTKLLCLKILRNMSFQQANRLTLMSSNDFFTTVSLIIGHALCGNSNTVSSMSDLTFEPQMQVSVAIWKLITGGIKFVVMLRGSKLAKKFRMLQEYLGALATVDPASFKQVPFAQDLSNVLDIIFGILTD